MAKTKKPKEVLKIPFDKDGNLMHYAQDYGSWYNPHNRVDNYEFDAVLRLEGVGREGRSAIVAWWEDEAGKRYCMFLSHLEDVILNSGIVKGLAAGRWTFCKKGSNYGIKLVRPSPISDDVATLAAVMLGGDLAAAAAFVDRATESIHG